MMCDVFLTNFEEESLNHTKRDHEGFDVVNYLKSLPTTTSDVALYRYIKLINYIRQRIIQEKGITTRNSEETQSHPSVLYVKGCLNCNSTFDSEEDLLRHMKESKHFTLDKNNLLWEDER